MNSAKLVLVALIWLVILAGGVSLWKFVIEPMRNSAKQKQDRAAAEEILKKSTGNSVYKHEIRLAADAFSGYAVLRSKDFAELLAQRGIRLKVEDDRADYAARLAGLADGTYQMAAFPIDALIKSSADSKSLPATIVSIIDETRGADAIVAYKSKFPTIDSLNGKETRFVLVGDSPSETLARVVMNNFDLPFLSERPFEMLGSPEELMAAYRRAIPAGNQLFATWEPYVSDILANDQMHVLIDSSRFTGYIVDSLVVSRDFLVKNQPVVEDVLECYFRAYYNYHDPSAMEKLIDEDARANKTVLTDKQVKSLVSKIQWKNTQDNFAHLGLRQGAVLPLENMIDRIMTVLLKTNAISQDPTNGQTNRLFYDPPMAQLSTRDFHPGLSSEKVTEQAALAPLSDDQWSKLIQVGTLSVPELVFARGSAQLTDRSRLILTELADKLQSWPSYYLLIRGSATNVGNAEANKRLAKERAGTALENLLSLGVPDSRMRIVDGEDAGQTRVSFEVGQLPY